MSGFWNKVLSVTLTSPWYKWSDLESTSQIPSTIDLHLAARGGTRGRVLHWIFVLTVPWLHHEFMGLMSWSFVKVVKQVTRAVYLHVTWDNETTRQNVVLPASVTLRKYKSGMVQRSQQQFNGNILAWSSTHHSLHPPYDISQMMKFEYSWSKQPTLCCGIKISPAHYVAVLLRQVLKFFLVLKCCRW